MKSDTRQNIQSGIDSLYELVEGCQLAMLVDQSTGLVLSANTDAAVSQDERDDLSARARAALSAAPTKAIGDEGEAGDTVTVTCVNPGGTALTAIRAVATDDVVLVCHFDRTPNRSDLSQAAADVLGLFATEEAA